MKKLIIISILIAWNYSLAGGHVVGNGGYVVKCFKDELETYESYDLVEGLISEGIEPQFSSAVGYINKAKEVIYRIKAINPTRHSLYMTWLNNFEKETKVVSGVDLVDIPDISIGVRPKGCSLIQAIIQNNIPESVNNRYLIDGDIWSKLDDNQRSALVIHELIYREAINDLNRHENSFYVRRYNQLLFSGKIKNLNLKDYILFIKNSHLSQADAHGISIMLFNIRPRFKEVYEYPIEFWNENAVKTAHIHLNGSINFQGVKANYACLNRNWQIFHDDFQVHFYSNHIIKSLRIPSVDDVDFKSKTVSCSGGRVDLHKYGFSGVMAANKFEFDKDGNLTLAFADYYVQGDILRLNDKKNLWVQVFSGLPEVDLIALVPFKFISFSAEACSNYRNWLVRENGEILEENFFSVEINKHTQELDYLMCPSSKSIKK